MTKFLQSFKSARRVSTPLIAVTTPDPAATMNGIINMKEDGAPGCPPMANNCVISWDIANGLRPMNEVARTAMAEIGIDDPRMGPEDMLATIQRLPDNSVVFFHNAHKFLESVGVLQAVWNIRDIFKGNFRTLILVAVDITLPAELAQDILVLDEPLPTNDELKQIARECYEAAGLEAPTEEVLDKIVDATCGLAAFPAEQCISMSLTKQGVDLDSLWERKRKMIENVKGLSVYRGKETLNDVVGLPNLVSFLRKVAKGKKKYRGIVFIDEVDKHVANFGAVGTGDTTQEMIGPVLSFMEDNEVDGVLLTGVPGCGKSLSSKALGNELGCPTIMYDFSGMKASHVGESGSNVRNANKVAYAMSQGSLLFVCTCNNVSNLPAEFRSRFPLGTFFFDTPTREGKDAAWTMYEKKHNLKKQPRPNDAGWTPREIRNCCRTADALSISLVEAAKYIVPVTKSNAQRVEALRREADGAYLDAVNEGFYKYQEPTSSVPQGRKINVG